MYVPLIEMGTHDDIEAVTAGPRVDDVYCALVRKGRLPLLSAGYCMLKHYVGMALVASISERRVKD